MYSFDGELVVLNSEVWACGIFVPKEVSEILVQNQQKRVVCTLNQSQTYQCALMPNGNNQYFVNVNKTIQKKLKISPGDSLAVQLVPDESEYGLPMPEELAELMRQDPEGDQFFHALTIGKQRTLLHLVGSPKSTDVRIKKALVIIQHLKNQQGKLDFKQLNIDFKAANNTLL